MDKRPIGVFDSGVGGLTVLKVLSQVLPREDFIYFGDSGRAPYGNDAPEIICQKSLQVADKVVRMGAKVLVIACNTIVATALERVAERFPLPVIGVIGPGARALASLEGVHKVLILATRRTVDSRAYPRAILRMRPDLEIIQRACPTFAPLVEFGERDGCKRQSLVDACLADLRGEDLDALVLACTHFPLLREEIGKSLPGLVMVDPAYETAMETARVLEKEGLVNPGPQKGTLRILTSGDPTVFVGIAQHFLGQELEVEFAPFV